MVNIMKYSTRVELSYYFRELETYVVVGCEACINLNLFLETQLYFEVYTGWPHKSCILRQVQPKWWMVG